MELKCAKVCTREVQSHFFSSSLSLPPLVQASVQYDAAALSMAVFLGSLSFNSLSLAERVGLVTLTNFIYVPSRHPPRLPVPPCSFCAAIFGLAAGRNAPPPACTAVPISGLPRFPVAFAR